MLKACILLFLFTPQFIIFGLVVKSYWFIVVFLALLEISKGKIPRKFFTFLNLLLASVVYILFNGLVHNVFDDFLISQIISTYFVLFSSLFIVKKYFEYYPLSWINRLTNDMLVAVLFNSCILIFSAFSEDFRNFIYQFISLTEKAARYTHGIEVSNPRYSGLTVSGFSYLSVLSSFVVIIHAYSSFKNNSFYSDKTVISNLIKYFIISASLLLVARTGLYIILLVIIGYSAMVVKARISERKFFIPVVVILMFIFIVSLVNLLMDDFIYFAFELFINYFNDGIFSSVTTDTLINEMFIFSHDIFEILFGTGNFGRGENYIDSDVGWVLFISGGGMLGVLLLYAPYVYIIYFGLANKKKFYLNNILSVTVILLLVLNFKDIYYLSHGYIQPIYILFSMCLIQGRALIGGKSFRNSIVSR